MKNLFLIIALITTSFTSIFAQDIIKLKSGEMLEVSITKIDKENIEFRPYGESADQAVIVVDKFLVESYKFEYATTKTTQYAEKLTNINTADLYDNRTFIAFKTQPLQLLRGNFKLGYEQSISYNQSFELELGMRTGLGLSFMDEMNTAPQLNVTSRYKYFYRPSSMKLTDTGKNPLHGLYIAPVLSVGNSINTNYDYAYDGDRIGMSNIYVAGMVDIGYQVVINKVIVDSFVGIGTSVNSTNEEFSFNSSHTSFGKSAIRAGFRMGINVPK